MIRRFFISSLIPLVTLLVIHFLFAPLNTEAFVSFYENQLRGSLFSGFLTLGGFLFSLKTFIIIKMKENVYEHEKYQARLIEQRKINPNISSFGPLRRLSDLLFYTVIASLICALLQFTLGFVSHWIAALVCSYIAFFALLLFVVSLFEIKQNLNYWFDFLESSAK